MESEFNQQLPYSTFLLKSTVLKNKHFFFPEVRFHVTRLTLKLKGSQNWLGAEITDMHQQDCDQKLLKASLRSLQGGGVAQWGAGLARTGPRFNPLDSTPASADSIPQTLPIPTLISFKRIYSCNKHVNNQASLWLRLYNLKGFFKIFNTFVGQHQYQLCFIT